MIHSVGDTVIIPGGTDNTGQRGKIVANRGGIVTVELKNGYMVDCFGYEAEPVKEAEK